MISEVKIVLYPELHKSKNGTFFEQLMQTIFSQEGYNMDLNINFTGLEIDLYGTHKRRNERLLVECKAKEKPKSTEVKNFLYNVLIGNKADFGYFFYTNKLDHQAAGLKADHEDDKRIHFFGPEEIISTLEDAKKIKKFDLSIFPESINIHKKTLAYTYFGIYYILVSYESTERKKYHIFDAKTLNSIHKNLKDSVNQVNINSTLLESIKELEKYDYLEFTNRVFSENSIDKYLDIHVDFNTYLNSMESLFAHHNTDTVTLEDLFITPDLQYISYENVKTNKKDNIYSLDDISTQNHENTSTKIAIIGDDTSGKSACSKILFKEYFDNNFLPVLINGRDFPANVRTARLIKLIQSKFSEQYNTNYNFEEDLDTSKIVIIIDDFQYSLNGNSKGWKNLLRNLESEFDHIIIFGSQTMPLKVSLKKNDTHTLFENFDLYRLMEFGPSLRSALIKKWYSIGDSNIIISENEILKKLDIANRHIKTIIGKNYVPAYPFYILSALQSLEAGNISNSNYSLYGFYYEQLIKTAITKSIEGGKKFNFYNNYLTKFCFYLFELKKLEVNSEEFTFFHNEFCKDLDYSFDKGNALNIFATAKLLKVNQLHGTVSVKEKFIYYYFVANYLANNIRENNIQSIIQKLVKRVYRDENASIIMFLTHLSKDKFILNELMNSAKSMFSATIFTKLENDIEDINNLIKTLPQQVVEKTINVSERRNEELELEDEIEAHEKERGVSNRLTSGNNMHQLDENINTIDYFAKITLSMKTIDILGQMARAYWGELNGKEKFELVYETYVLGLRTLGSYFELIINNSQGIAEHLSSIISKKHIKDRFEIKKQAQENASDFIFRLSFLATWGLTKRISSAIGTKELKNTFDKVLINNNFNSIKLIDLSIKLDYTSSIPFNDIKKYKKELHKNNICMIMLQNLALNYMYMFNTNYEDKAKICSLLGIKIIDQRKIDIESNQKKE